ncbi:MAG: hypothetical protein ABI065_07620 [Terrimesophilobacter sp.]
MPADPDASRTARAVVAASAAGASDGPDAIDGLTRVLAKACRQLGDSGHPKDAAALAAQGWALLRTRHPAQADRLDGTMHYLARLEAKLEQ